MAGRPCPRCARAAASRRGPPVDRGRRLPGHPGRPAGGVSTGLWLKALGHAREPLPARWLEDGSLRSLRRTGFPRRPRMDAGDRLVYYASVWQRVFAIVEVVAEPERIDHPRWPWTVAVEPPLIVPARDAAPPVQAIGVFARSMSQQSHIRLTPDQFERAVEALASVAAREL